MSLDTFSLNTDSSFSHEISEKDFMEKVMQKSQKHPVIVQFLHGYNIQVENFKNLLEQTLSPLKGKVSFFTLDTQKNYQLTSQLAQIGMPVELPSFCAVFTEQQVKDVLPLTSLEENVQSFFKKTLGDLKSSFDKILESAEKAYDEQYFDQACALYSELLEIDSEKPIPWVGFLNCLLKLSEIEACEEALQNLPKAIQNSDEIRQIKEKISNTKLGLKAAEQLDVLTKEYQNNSENLDIQFKLAQALAGAGKKDESSDMLLGIIAKDPHFNDDQARLELLQYFDTWGHSDPSTLRARRKLSSLLFA